MNLMLNMKDINKILAKTHFKCREKSSLPIFCKCGEPWLLVFIYLIAAYASVRQCVIIICRCPQNIIEMSLSRKNVHRSML